MIKQARESVFIWGFKYTIYISTNSDIYLLPTLKNMIIVIYASNTIFFRIINIPISIIICIYYTY